MTTTSGQLALFGGLPFADVLPTEVPEASTSSPACTDKALATEEPPKQAEASTSQIPAGRGIKAFEAAADVLSQSV